MKELIVSTADVKQPEPMKAWVVRWGGFGNGPIQQKIIIGTWADALAFVRPLHGNPPDGPYEFTLAVKP
jgi:hypothetical protein